MIPLPVVDSDMMGDCFPGCRLDSQIDENRGRDKWRISWLLLPTLSSFFHNTYVMFLHPERDTRYLPSFFFPSLCLSSFIELMILNM